MDQRIAARLVEYRQTAGLSQEKLAEQLNVSRQAVSKWERGESLPDIGNIYNAGNMETFIDAKLSGGYLSVGARGIRGISES